MRYSKEALHVLLKCRLRSDSATCHRSQPDRANELCSPGFSPGLFFRIDIYPFGSQEVYERLLKDYRLSGLASRRESLKALLLTDADRLAGAAYQRMVAIDSVVAGDSVKVSIGCLSNSALETNFADHSSRSLLVPSDVIFPEAILVPSASLRQQSTARQGARR